MREQWFTESVVEQAALAWLESMGYLIASGPEIAPSETVAERDDYGQVVLERRLRQALQRLNPQVPPDALEEAFRKLTRPDLPSLVANNHVIHKYLVEGVPVEYQRTDGSIGGDLVRVFDYGDPENNEFLAVNQFTVVEDQHERRPDVVLFINGLPVAVIELKNAASGGATIWSAFNQLQTYKRQIPSLFAFNAALVISDGVQARIGTLTADREWFMPWRTIQGEELADTKLPQLQVVLEGVFEKRRFLDLIRHFIVFEDVGGGVLVKKMAGYHQYHAVNLALESTVRAASTGGDKRVGVVWHTQGSGKSLTMAFYAGRVVLHPAMENPTLVVITDRNDLDDQLYGTFARCHELLRQQPMQAESRAHLRELLRTASGGVVFTTVHKFFPTDGEDRHPLLSDRRNIVVIADEAHRSQYDFIDGFARHMREALPNASFIGFTGTPIELTDKNTRAVLGDYISIYDIERAVKDGATVPIYYESRLARLELDESAKPLLDEEFEEATEGEEVEHKERLKTKWAQLEALVGTEKRLKLIAEDLVKHFETRLEAMDGKAMIVCMSRRICVELYRAIVAIRPDWHHDDDNAGIMKIVMTGSASDPEEWQGHIRTKSRREELAKRFKDPKDPFKVVIVRDMWLTGFDAPCLHTMYVDKPMRGHGLMQAIARVNRVFKDKPGGLVVAYRADQPNMLLISGQWQTEDDVFTLEYDLTSGEQSMIECDGQPAYKCTILGDQMLYAQRIGEQFEHRRVTAAKSIARHSVASAVRRQGGQVQPIATQPMGNCGCRRRSGPGDPMVTRASCVECVEKHLGAAYVLLTETRDGYAHRLRAVGHLHEAEDESQEWPELHNAIRAARKAYQTDGTMPDWESLAGTMARTTAVKT